MHRYLLLYLPYQSTSTNTTYQPNYFCCCMWRRLFLYFSHLPNSVFVAFCMEWYIQLCRNTLHNPQPYVNRYAFFPSGMSQYYFKKDLHYPILKKTCKVPFPFWQQLAAQLYILSISSVWRCYDRFQNPSMKYNFRVSVCKPTKCLG